MTRSGHDGIDDWPLSLAYLACLVLFRNNDCCDWYLLYYFDYYCYYVQRTDKKYISNTKIKKKHAGRMAGQEYDGVGWDRILVRTRNRSIYGLVGWFQVEVQSDGRSFWSYLAKRRDWKRESKSLSKFLFCCPCCCLLQKPTNCFQSIIERDGDHRATNASRDLRQARETEKEREREGRKVERSYGTGVLPTTDHRMDSEEKWRRAFLKLGNFSPLFLFVFF